MLFHEPIGVTVPKPGHWRGVLYSLIFEALGVGYNINPDVLPYLYARAGNPGLLVAEGTVLTVEVGPFTQWAFQHPSQFAALTLNVTQEEALKLMAERMKTLSIVAGMSSDDAFRTSDGRFFVEGDRVCIAESSRETGALVCPGVDPDYLFTIDSTTEMWLGQCNCGVGHRDGAHEEMCNYGEHSEQLVRVVFPAGYKRLMNSSWFDLKVANFG